MSPNPTPPLRDHDLLPETGSLADRLVERHLAGSATIDELLEFDIDAQTIMRAVLLARRAAARAPRDRNLSSRSQALDELYRRLRLAALDQETSLLGGRLIDTYASREAEVLELIRDNGGHRTFETLPTRLQELRPLTVKRLVERRALLMIGGDLGTGIYPSCQFLPSGQVIKGLPEVWAALGCCDQLSMIAFLLCPDPDMADFQPIELLRAGRISDIVALARDRI